MVPALPLLASLIGCVHPLPPPELPWNAEPRDTSGQIAVLPVVGTYDTPYVRFDESITGLQVPEDRQAARRLRSAQLLEIPDDVATSLPGAAQVALGDAWDATFVSGRWPVGAREHLAAALKGKGDVDGALAEAGRAGGDAVLVTWVDRLDGDPLTAMAPPGFLLRTDAGPVVVDLQQEAYRVRAHIGMALVAPDGEVVLRYTDDFEGLLTEEMGPDRVGRQLAQDLAAEVVKVWPSDPREALDEGPHVALR